MRALTALTSRGPLDDEPHEVIVEESAIIDMYTGYTPDLNDVFRQTGLAARLLGEEREAKGRELEEAVRMMIGRDQRRLSFPIDVHLEKEDIRQFAACNIAYQHSALIHILRRLRGVDAASIEVQECVRTILCTLESILPMNALSPWALMTTPIFTAG